MPMRRDPQHPPLPPAVHRHPPPMPPMRPMAPRPRLPRPRPRPHLDRLGTHHRGDPMSSVLHHGDCLDVMRGLPDASIDAIVTDPPYGLGFMGKAWDDLPPGLPWATECLRVLKPGGHLLAFGGTRTWHRLACAVEDAGFEVRDSIAWLYGSGFPKSLDVSKAIDKARDDSGEVLAVTTRLADLAEA